ncbi:MAG: hypothetical protein ABIH26_03295 [Candidatus Eisenbacteria bacterium]
MAARADKVECRTPTPGRSATRVDRWKFEAVRRAILAVPSERKEGAAFRDLPGLVAKMLAARERAELGSVSWYTTTVKLELEVRGEIRRVPGARPQRLTRTRPRSAPSRS